MSEIPTTANAFIERELGQRLATLEASLDADCVCIYGTMLHGLDDLVRSLIEAKREQSSRPRLAVLLTTTGGYIEPVQRIVETIRHHYQDALFIIPNYAFSAGTVFAMSGDHILMDYYSRLGPIDPQIENLNGRSVPALGYLRQWERLLEKAVDGTLTTVEAQIMVHSFDQAELYAFEQAQELSIALLKDWLVRFKFKDWVRKETSGEAVTEEMKIDRAEEIARALSDTDRWHSHGYGISMAVLHNDLNLKIDDMSAKADVYEQVKHYDSFFADYLRQRGFRGGLHMADRFLPYE